MHKVRTAWPVATRVQYIAAVAPYPARCWTSSAALIGSWAGGSPASTFTSPKSASSPVA